MKRCFIVVISSLLFSFMSFAQNEDISGGNLFEGEPYLALDPANPQHMVVAWMGYVPIQPLHIKTKVTFDGGQNWSNAVAIPHVSSTYKSADPSLAFDHNGNVFLSYVDYRQAPDSGAVYVVKSTDGGLSWSSPNMVLDGFADGSKEPIDRPWLVIGKAPASSVDTMYITTKPAPWILPPNRPYFMKSYDDGQTWSPWKYIDSTGWQVGNLIQAPMAAPVVDANGRFHCVYPAYYAPENLHVREIMASLIPGTNSFSYSNTYVFTAATAVNDTLSKGGPHLIADPANPDHMAFFWVFNYNNDMDVFCVESTDNGNSWGALQRVNDDPVNNGRMQDLVWASFDEHGDIVAAWRDRRNAPDTGYAQPSEIWGAVKWKDSANFSANFRISDTIVDYDSTYLAGKGNDFMNVVMAQDTVSAVWGDVRTGVLNIWFNRMAVNGPSTGIKKLVNEKAPGVDIYPNPSGNAITIKGEDMLTVTVYDVTGKLLLQQKAVKDKAVINIAHFKAGAYFAVISTKRGVVTERFEKR